jgi:signal transduction histidine kinase/ligand-binding sensor domain-containing protein
VRFASARGTGAAIILAAAVCAMPAHAQRMAHATLPVQALRHMHHTTFGPADGLPAAGEPSMAQSPDGYLWIGAAGRLIRFDGVRFVSIDSLTSHALRAPDHELFRVLSVDPAGVMWVSRSDGALIRYERGRFSVAAGPDSTRRSMTHAASDRLGRLWFVTRQGVGRFENGKVGTPALPAALATRQVTGIVADTGTGVWMGERDGSIWHVDRNIARRYARRTPSNGAGAWPRLQSSDGLLWVQSDDGLQTMQDGRWTTITMPNGEPIRSEAAIETHDGQILVATQGQGVLRVLHGAVEQYSTADGLTDVHVESAYEDAEHDYWFLTDAGLDQLHVVPIMTLGRGDGVPFASPLVIQPDARRGIWVQAYEDGRVFHATGGVVDGEPGAVHWTAITFPSREVHYPMASSPSGGVWAVGTGRDGLFRVSSANVVTALPFANDVILPSAEMLEDPAGNLWTSRQSTHNRVTLGHVTGKRFVDGLFVSRAAGAATKGESFYVGSMALGTTGHLWLVDARGANIYEAEGDSVFWRAATSYASGTFTRIVHAGGDTLWVVPMVGDFLRIIGHDVRRVRMPGSRWRFSPGGLNVAVAGDGFWIATEAVVLRYSLAAMNAYADGRAPAPTARPYSEEDGLRVPRVTFSNSSATFAKDGRWWASTPGGVAVYDPRFDVHDSVPPQPFVEEINVDGTTLAPTSAIDIPPRSARVEIHYTATSLRAPAKVRMEYRLDRADMAWVAGTASRVATYTQLRPGKYTFRVRAWNEDGVASLSDGALAFTVLPTWYQTTWCRLLALLALVSGGPLMVHAMQRSRSRAREAQLRARFDAALAERTRVAGELHDTLLQGFTGITLQLGGVERLIPTSPAQAVERLSLVLGLADATLRDARRAIWDMRSPELGELGERGLPDALERSVRAAMHDGSIALSFTMAGTPRRLSPQVESAVLRIGREALVNAVRHAKATRIEMRLAYTANTLRLAVSDDGCGVRASDATAAPVNGHFGLSGMRERALRVHASLQINGTSEGTLVSLEVPLEPESEPVTATR